MPYRYHFIQNWSNTSKIIQEIIDLRVSRIQVDKEFVSDEDNKKNFNLDLVYARIKHEEIELTEIREDLRHKLEEEARNSVGVRQGAFLLMKMQDLIESI